MAEDDPTQEPPAIKLTGDALWVANRYVSNLIHGLPDGSIAIGVRRLKHFPCREDGPNYDAAAANILKRVLWRVGEERRWRTPEGKR
jgi:hypothetical protein